MVRLMLLERLLQHLSQLHNVGGVQAIPYMQVILMLTSDLDGEDEKDKGALDDLLAQLIAELGMHKKASTATPVSSESGPVGHSASPTSPVCRMFPGRTSAAPSTRSTWSS